MCFVVLVFATGFLVSWNSPDGKLERALDKIIAEHGFEFNADETETWLERREYATRTDVYDGGPISQERERQIIARLSEACPECTVEIETVEGNGKPITVPYSGPNSEPQFVVYYWYPAEGSAVKKVLVINDEKWREREGDLPASNLLIVRSREPDRWSFLKNLWPW